MRMTRFAVPVCAVLLCIGATSPMRTRPQSPNDSKVTPLILEKNEGERRVWRPVEGLTGQKYLDLRYEHWFRRDQRDLHLFRSGIRGLHARRVRY